MCALSDDWPERARRALSADSALKLAASALATRLDEAIETSSPLAVRERLSLLIEYLNATAPASLPPERTERLLSWAARKLAVDRQDSDIVPGWDPDLRALFDMIAEVAPSLLDKHAPAFPERARRQIDFSMALSGRGPWTFEGLPAVARRWLNCPVGTFAYEEKIPLAVLSDATRELLRAEPVPLMQWVRIAPLLDGADDEFRSLILSNYCAQDFRSKAFLLAERSSPRFTELLYRALDCDQLPFTGAISAALVLTQWHGQEWITSIPATIRRALLWDLRCGNDFEANISLGAYRSLSEQLAGELLRECLREQRAIALIPAVNDDQVIADLLLRLDESNSVMPVTVESLAACGERSVPHILQACEGKSPSASLAGVCIEVLAVLKPPGTARAMVNLLGHKSRKVVAGAIKMLERMDEAAREELQQGRQASKKGIRTHCQRLLIRLADKHTDEVTPLVSVRERAAALDSNAREEFRQAWRSAGNSEAIWQSELKPRVHTLGALALELARVWFEEMLEDGETRLWCYAVEELRGDPEAVWVAVDTFARMPKLSASLWARPRRALGHCGQLLGPPIVHCLRSVHTEYREVLYGLLATHASEADVAVLLQGLSDDSQAVRTHAVDALSRMPNGPSREVAVLLRSGEVGTRIAAAELLAVWGHPQVAAMVADAWKAEKSGKVRPQLEDALVACGGEERLFALNPGQKLDPAALEAFLRQQKLPKTIPGFIRLSALPPLRYAEGQVLSEQARQGLLARLLMLDSSLKGRVVRRLLPVLDRSDLDAWGRAVYEGWAKTRLSKYKFAVLQLSLFASEALLDEAMSGLGQWRGAEHTAISAHLRAAQWHGSALSVRWLGYWSETLASLGARATARQLLGRIAFKKQITLRELRQTLDPFLGEEREERLAESQHPAGPAREKQIFELERSWLSGRTWSASAVVKLTSLQAYLQGESLLWRTSGGTLCCYRDGSLLALDETPIPSEARLHLVHPVQLTPDERLGLPAHLGSSSALAQLDRRTYRVEQLETWMGRSASPHAFARWRRHNRWFHGEPMDAGIVYADSLHLPGRNIIITLHHTGYSIGAAEFEDEVRLLGLDFSDLEGEPQQLPGNSEVMLSELQWTIVQLLDGD